MMTKLDAKRLYCAINMFINISKPIYQVIQCDFKILQTPIEFVWKKNILKFIHLFC